MTFDPLCAAAASFSSLSFVMVPPPEDEVAVQLQQLVDRCRHGNNYCKQVLSLYQLSKVTPHLLTCRLCVFPGHVAMVTLPPSSL